MSRIDHLKNFGFAKEVSVVAPGINGKMSEFNAALGLLQLKYVDQALERRRRIVAAYRNYLGGTKGIRCLGDAGEKVTNCNYFPIFVEADYPLSRDELYLKLKRSGIHPRRYSRSPLYFGFPNVPGVATARQDNLPNATDAASKILCLPIYPGLEQSEVATIAKAISNI